MDLQSVRVPASVRDLGADLRARPAKASTALCTHTSSKASIASGRKFIVYVVREFEYGKRCGVAGRAGW